MLIDSHCHLDFPDFADDFDGMLARAAAAGVGTMVTISTRVREFQRYASLAERHANIWCTVGTHPHQAGNETDVTVEELVTLSAHPRCVGIGEAGLDYFYDKAPRDLQRKSLLIHIDAARRTGLPLVIHARDADDDMAAILTEEMGKGAFKAILHCFSSGAALARTGVALGLYVSFSGILTFKNSQALRDIAAELPADRLLVETDAPYLAPMPHRGKRNEPAYVADTARVLAEVRGLDMAALTALTAANTRRVFAKMGAAMDAA